MSRGMVNYGDKRGLRNSQELRPARSGLNRFRLHTFEGTDLIRVPSPGEKAMMPNHVRGGPQWWVLQPRSRAAPCGIRPSAGARTWRKALTLPSAGNPPFFFSDGSPLTLLGRFVGFQDSGTQRYELLQRKVSFGIVRPPPTDLEVG
jgi:hypothetical protein